jgi:Flp pilus assembly protein TadG
MSRAIERRRLLSEERGSAMVEMVIVVPVLLLILFGIVELSRAWFTLQVAASAAREGARAGAVANIGDEKATGEARIDALLSAAGLTATSRSVDKMALPGATDFEIVSTVTLTFTTTLPLVPQLQGLSLSESASMRFECNPFLRPCS